eukprot:TRINITY_DN31626_c0_g1_i1.p1 TRINITY_DN31626_c0_g1~~TRINITY_DN31626_c0_g1_i1.p1  ORF type:complete len:288 (-),score=47.61 TRINITY_DN31626_c0_g1_i1:162-908(-)
MAEAYDEFLAFDWSHEGWQAYLENLYPPPRGPQLLKFRKKWYKKNIDSAFDDTYEPPAPPAPEPQPAQAGDATSKLFANGANPFTDTALDDGARWKKIGKKATICWLAYALSLTLMVAAAADCLPAYQALVVAVVSFILEVIAKHGIKFKGEYLHAVLLDDVGVLPIMTFTLLMPGMHPYLRTCAMAPSFLTALMSFSLISRVNKKVPKLAAEFFAPLAEPASRYRLMQLRADCELCLGIDVRAAGRW